METGFRRLVSTDTGSGSQSALSVRVQHPAGPSIPAKYTCTDVASDLIPDPSACVWSYVKTKNKAPAVDQQDAACTAIASMQPRVEYGHLTGAKNW